MQITDAIHALKVPFELPLPDGGKLKRFVYAYLIYGETITLIDCAVRGYYQALFDYVRKTGRDPEEIALGVLTHAHPDHIGGALYVRDEIGCEFAAHGYDLRVPIPAGARTICAYGINVGPGGNQTCDIIGDLYNNNEINATWGLHLIDMSLVMGNLVDIVGQQAKRYAAK